MRRDGVRRGAGAGDGGDAGEGDRVGGACRRQYGVWREGEHDDLVFAVPLACWGVKKLSPQGLDGDENWWRRDDQRELGRLLYGVRNR